MTRQDEMSRISPLNSGNSRIFRSVKFEDVLRLYLRIEQNLEIC